jgi:hypothetical protein
MALLAVFVLLCRDDRLYSTLIVAFGDFVCACVCLYVCYTHTLLRGDVMKHPTILSGGN